MSKNVANGVRCLTCRKRLAPEHFRARPDHVPADRAALAERLAAGLDAAPARVVRQSRLAHSRTRPGSRVMHQAAAMGDPLAEAEAEDADRAGAGSRWWHGWGVQGWALVAGAVLLLGALVFAAWQGNANVRAAAQAQAAA